MRNPKSPLNVDAAALRRPGYGRTRTEGPMNTDFIHKYMDLYDELKEKYGKGSHPLYYDFDGRKITLTEIIIEDETGKLLHPPVGEVSNDMDEHRWSAISDAYARAIDEGKGYEGRKKAALECYALLSHDCPFARGSTTFARIVLEFLSLKVGFDVPLAKMELDFNLKAVTRSVEDFINEWESGQYFDPQTSRSEVMNWQETRAHSALYHRSNAVRHNVMHKAHCHSS